jgi:CoA:oxalate CoA-transferase
MNRAFAGLRVIDFTTTIAGPHCTRLLADLGADVVKIEAPEGDVMRSRPPLRNGVSSYFGQLNAGKRSVVLDLKDSRAVAAARRLAEQTDILVENYRPGVMQRLGLDFAVLGHSNPRLIYCSISGYGQTGPSSDLPAYAPVIHATSGYDLAHLAYQRGRSQPDNCGIYVADVITGTYAFGAIATALHQRQTLGRAQHIDVSMLESMLSLTLTELQSAQFEVPPPPSRPIFGPVATVDGYLNMAVVSERTFQGLAAAAGRLDWISDPRFAVYLARRANWGELMDEFEEWSRHRSTPAVWPFSIAMRFRRLPTARSVRR